MTTLMSFTNSNGTRRCDSRCYNGKGHRCRCICGGQNHGVGLDEAVKNTRTLWKGWKFNEDVLDPQLPLFSRKETTT